MVYFAKKWLQCTPHWPPYAVLEWCVIKIPPRACRNSDPHINICSPDSPRLCSIINVFGEKLCPGCWGGCSAPGRIGSFCTHGAFTDISEGSELESKDIHGAGRRPGQGSNLP